MQLNLKERNITPRKDEIRKKINECLERIAKNHTDGCVEWATSFPGNEWENAFDILEKSWLQDSDALVLRKLISFEIIITNIQERYKKIKGQLDLLNQ